MSLDVAAAIALASRSLAEQADPEKAAGMQAYMKTDMPFYGVQKPGREPILKRLVAEFPPDTREEYEALVVGLWDLSHREEKYLAQGVAVAHEPFIVPDSLPLYRRLIVEGAWWDLVDETATHLIRELILDHPDVVWPLIDPWIDDEDIWLRRSVIICQVGIKEKTDQKRLFAFCLRRAHEGDFFIRKAIGWALRDYARTEPEAVAAFVNSNRGRLSGLSYGEATKHIGELVGP